MLATINFQTFDQQTFARCTSGELGSGFQKSLERLKVSSLDAFLLHRSSSLIGPNGDELIKWLESLRARGLVKRLGVSIYEASD